MSGLPQRTRLPQDEQDNEEAAAAAAAAHRRFSSLGTSTSGRAPQAADRGLTFSASSRDPFPSASFESMRSQQQLMAAAMLDNSSSRAASALSLLPSSVSAAYPHLSVTRTASMASLQGQLNAPRPSSLWAAGMTPQEQEIRALQQHQQVRFRQQQQSLHQLQQHQQHAIAAAEHAQTQKEDFEFHSLLRQKRQIDEMLLSSALSSRRFSMDSDLYSHAAGAGRGALSGQSATSLHLASFNASAPSLNSGAFSGANHPEHEHSDLILGKIRGLESERAVNASWWELSGRRLSSPQHNQLPATRAMMERPVTLRPAFAMPSYDEHVAGAVEGGTYEEEDDATYFDDKGSDEVDRDFKRSQENFPLKLYRIIYEVVKSGKGDVISFFPHGRAFAVHKPADFMNEIMPKYFGSGRMNTFLKQLNLYGFRRITEGRDKGGYFHPSFINGKRPLCKLIKRKKTDSKPTKAAGASKQATGKSKEVNRKPNPIYSTDEFVTSLNQKMKMKQAQREEETESPSPSPSSSRHPKMRWKKQQVHDDGSGMR